MNNDKISFAEIISEIFIKEYLFIYLLLANILWKNEEYKSSRFIFA